MIVRLSEESLYLKICKYVYPILIAYVLFFNQHVKLFVCTELFKYISKLLEVFTLSKLLEVFTSICREKPYTGIFVQKKPLLLAG